MLVFPLPLGNDDFCFQGRHTKTGQLAAIKVMDVTEVSVLCEIVLVTNVINIYDEYNVYVESDLLP